MKINLHSLLGILLGALFAAIQPALAQTPDGETPANEGVCDALVGATPGLYGLCVAFCEAQDAEAEYFTETGEIVFSEGSRPSNPRLLDVYNKKKAPGDPSMPCVVVVEPPAISCPCWSEAELATVAEYGTFYSDELLYGTYLDGRELLDPVSRPNYEWARAWEAASKVWNTPVCTVMFRDNMGQMIYRFLETTPEQTATCRQSIRDEAVSRGIISP